MSNDGHLPSVMTFRVLVRTRGDQAADGIRCTVLSVLFCSPNAGITTGIVVTAAKGARLSVIKLMLIFTCMYQFKRCGLETSSRLGTKRVWLWKECSRPKKRHI